MRVSIILGAVLPLLGGCGEEPIAEVPPPQALTREAVGYYCNMIVADHAGPKGQIFLTDREEPLWFTSVRDTLAFTMLPGEPKNIAAAYVNDTGQASWPVSVPGDWIDARSAWYVIGGDVVGGMGAPEAVAFARRVDAEAFVEKYGGAVVAFGDIPADAILASGDDHEAGAGNLEMDDSKMTMPKTMSVP